MAEFGRFRDIWIGRVENEKKTIKLRLEKVRNSKLQ